MNVYSFLFSDICQGLSYQICSTAAWYRCRE